MYERIIVGTDGSAQALEAVRVAARLSELCGNSQLHVVAACDTLSTAQVSRIRAELPDEFRDLVNPHLDAGDRFNEAALLLGPSLSLVPHEKSGDPADSILEVAESVDADLIVVGARGLGTVERFLRGSVSTKVAHHSPCDVLVVEHDN